MRVVLAIDGGAVDTTLRLEGVDNGIEVAERTIKTNRDDPWRMLLRIVDTTKELLDGSGHILCGIGMGVAAAVKRGIVVGSGSLPDWEGTNLVEALQGQFQLPTVVVDDHCVMAALAEYDQLPKAAKRDILAVLWSAGVGAAVVLHEPGHGPIVRPTQFGHHIVDMKSLKECGCQGRGHLEPLVGGDYLPGRFRQVSSHEVTTAQWRLCLRDMAVGLRNLSSTLSSVGIIVIGGEVMLRESHRLEALADEMRALPSPATLPEVRLTALGDKAAVRGAGAAVRAKLRSSR